MTAQFTGVLLDTTRLFVMRPEFQGAACVECRKPHARWCYGSPEDGSPVCGLCFLYETDSYEDIKEQLELLIEQVERVKLLSFEKKDGRLAKVEDADGILGSITIANRLVAHKERIEGPGKKYEH